MKQGPDGSEDDVIVLEQIPQTEDEYIANEREIASSGTKYCSGVVSNTAGDRCSNSECARLQNTKLYYVCDGDECPIKAGRWYSIPHRCTPGGIKWLTGCKVQFTNVTGCS